MTAFGLEPGEGAGVSCFTLTPTRIWERLEPIEEEKLFAEQVGLQNEVEHLVGEEAEVDGADG